MKVFIIPVDNQFQPHNQPFLYPPHNSDFGVEQDMYEYLLKNPELITRSPENADWHYLPIYWTRWYLNHNYGKSGREELQEAVNRAIIDDIKTFTICQYDDGPIINIGRTKQFLASRKTDMGIDIPLLCTPHRLPFIKPRKKYLASFIGRLSTHPIRQIMADELNNQEKVFIFDGDNGTQFYINKLLQSKIALCPRGYGGSSFRFYEAMQLKIVPFLIGDLDTRPFKDFIYWKDFSFYSNMPEAINNCLAEVNTHDLERMGFIAFEKWKNELTYQKWCKYVIMELEKFS